MPGLALAIGGPLLLASPVGQFALGRFGDGPPVAGEVALWLIVALVLFVLRYGERQPLAAIGLVRPKPASVLWGLGIGLSVFIILAAAAVALSQFGLFENEEASAIVLQWPVWYRVVAAVSAGVIEETLYRGYAIERLAALLGGVRVAAVVALAGFALTHVPFWGWAAIATPLLGGGFFTFLYVWRRDLVACMVAHSTIDLIGMVLIPALTLDHASG